MKLLSLKEVCQMVGCTDPKGRYVRNLRAQGKIQGAKFGTHLMFTEESVNRFIENEFRKQNPQKKADHLRPTGDMKFPQTLSPLYQKKEKANG